MSNLRIAILDSVLPHQIRERPRDLEGVDIVWQGTSPTELEASFDQTRPAVLVLDLDTLGAEDPVARVRDLQKSSQAELVITLYRFARREVVSELAKDGRRAVRAPISLSGLRTQMLGSIIKSILHGQEATAVAHAAPPRKFSTAQLGRLAEIESAVQCECPNHLSTILLSLTSFEDYSAKCESLNDADAAVHGALYEHTARARAIMEDALAILLKHEKIVL